MVDAGCQPVRVITSADGSKVWVTARASDDLLCFPAARLVADPAHALVAIVRVVEAPVRLAAVHGGSLIVVADSSRFGALYANSNLDVVNVAVAVAGAACGGRSYPVRVVPAQDGPAAGQLEAVDVASIPVANASPYRPVSFSDSMRPGMRHSTGSTWSSSGMWQRRFVPDAPGQSQRRNHPEQDLINPRGGDF